MCSETVATSPTNEGPEAWGGNGWPFYKQVPYSCPSEGFLNGAKKGRAGLSPERM
jgi:hypothetical protein